MKVSLYIHQHVGAETFPYFPYFPALQQDQRHAITALPCNTPAPSTSKPPRLYQD
jgi:hypothetical protein